MSEEIPGEVHPEQIEGHTPENTEAREQLVAEVVAFLEAHAAEIQASLPPGYYEVEPIEINIPDVPKAVAALQSGQADYAFNLLGSLAHHTAANHRMPSSADYAMAGIPEPVPGTEEAGVISPEQEALIRQVRSVPSPVSDQATAYLEKLMVEFNLDAK